VFSEASREGAKTQTNEGGYEDLASVPFLPLRLRDFARGVRREETLPASRKIQNTVTKGDKRFPAFYLTSRHKDVRAIIFFAIRRLPVLVSFTPPSISHPPHFTQINHDDCDNCDNKPSNCSHFLPHTKVSNDTKAVKERPATGRPIPARVAPNQSFQARCTRIALGSAVANHRSLRCSLRSTP